MIPADDEQVPTGLDANLIPGGKEGFQYSINSNSAGASPPLKYVIDSKPTTGFALIYPVKGGAPIHLDSMKSSPHIKTKGSSPIKFLAFKIGVALPIGPFCLK